MVNQAIFRRKKGDQIDSINKIWPQGENAAELLEVLSDNPIERRYAFEKFIT